MKFNTQKESLRTSNNYIGRRAAWAAKLLLIISYPFPRFYRFIATSTGSIKEFKQRIWKIQRGPLKGFKLTSLTPEEIWPVLTNCMEIHCANLLSRLPIDKSVALDVGGSYGFYALLLSRLDRKSVV